MCGIAGVLSGKDKSIGPILEKANWIQFHRGPDHQAYRTYLVNDCQVGLAHQRLSIIDTTSASHQPFESEDGRYALTYNGEIYNYLEIKKQLIDQGISFSTKSDTEVLFRSLIHWGFDDSLHRFNGMWSFAFLDRRKAELTLCRDRMGIKPLYFREHNNDFYFASEIKTVLEMSQSKVKLNPQVLGEYLSQSLTETDPNKTFFDQVFKVPPGQTLRIQLSENFKKEFKCYYRLGIQNWQPKSMIELADQVKNLFQESVQLRLRSDVPIGILLSGGLDSSSISSLAFNQNRSGQLNLLSAVSDGSQFDEAPFIDTMSEHLSHPTEKIQLAPNPSEALRLLGDVCYSNDQPVGSFSNIAHFLLMKKARELGTTVILSGQGADEILCGYKKFLGFYLQSLLYNKHPLTFLKVFAQFFFNGTILKQFRIHEAKRYLPFFYRQDSKHLYGHALSDYKPVFTGIASDQTLNERQLLDVTRFSVPTLLHTEDRMSMAQSRELRVPFLDHRLVELLLSLPVQFKLNKGWTKYIFRLAMQNELPSSITWRKDKQGFVNPQSEWLKSSLKQEVLKKFHSDAKIFQLNLLNRNVFLERYDQYCRQGVDSGSLSFKDIFNPLALELWLEKYEGFIQT